MDTIKGTVSEIANDYENVFHITVTAQIPEGVALVRFDPTKLGTEPYTNVANRSQDEPFQLVATTIGKPALNVGDFLPIEVFYHNEVVLKDGQTVPFSELQQFPKIRFRTEGKVTQIRRANAEDEITCTFLTPPGFQGGVTLEGKLTEPIPALPPPLVERTMKIAARQEL